MTQHQCQPTSVIGLSLSGRTIDTLAPDAPAPISRLSVCRGNAPDKKENSRFWKSQNREFSFIYSEPYPADNGWLSKAVEPIGGEQWA